MSPAAMLVGPLLLAVFCACGQAFPFRRTGPAAGHPVVLIPGFGGNQLWAKLDGKPVVPHYLCDKTTSDYFDLWLNLEFFPPYVIDCFADNMKLLYDNATRTTRSNDGVNVTVRDWGNTSTVEWLDPTKWSTGHYFASIVNEAVAKWGYYRGKNVRGAPFDWRKAPNELDDFYDDLKALIEETYYNNGNNKVVTIAHSMGNPVTWHFLTRQSQDWKDKFIKSHVALSGPWGGSMKIMLLYASGYNFDHYRIVLPPLSVRGMQRSFTSSTFLIPSPHYWNKTEVLSSTPDKNYTVDNYEEFFHDIGYPVGWEMFKDTANITWSLPPPNVEIHCIHGSGLPTPLRFDYAKGQFPDTQPTFVNGDGDSTVNMRSLLGCLRWRKMQDAPVKHLVINGTAGEHIQIMQSQTVIDYIGNVLHDRL